MLQGSAQEVFTAQRHGDQLQQSLHSADWRGVAADVIGQDAAQQAEENQRGGSDSGLVAANEFVRAVNGAFATRTDRATVQITANVFGQLFDRLITALRLA